jgi:hypothetical protein
VITLFYVWFAVLDRYLIFLYFHDMGPGFDTTPFGRVTVGRYWMSGLVASGAVMIPYTALNFTLGRVFKTFRAPVWWRVWILCAIALLVAIPIIVMTVNDPVLPVRHAARVTAVLLAGLALAVRLGQLAAVHPGRYALLMFDGGALACLLIALRAAEVYPDALARGNLGLISRFLAVLAVGIGLLVAMSAVYTCWRRSHVPDAESWLVAGMNVHYLFLPLYHHLCWCKDDGSWLDADYFAYIPAAGDYFCGDVLYQVGVWAVVALVALAATWLRSRLSRRRMAADCTLWEGEVGIGAGMAF